VGSKLKKGYRILEASREVLVSFDPLSTFVQLQKKVIETENPPILHRVRTFAKVGISLEANVWNKGNFWFFVKIISFMISEV